MELDELPALALDLEPLQAAEDADAVIGVDDIIAGLEVLELGEEGAPGGAVDDDLFLGEDVLLGEKIQLLLRIAEPSRQGAEEESDLGAGRDGERRLGFEDGDLAFPEQGGQALARPRIGKIDVTEVALGLELLQVLEKERDLVVETRHGLKGEGKDLLPGRGAEFLEAHGLLADPLEKPRREDLLRREGEDAVGEEVGVLAAELLDESSPLAVHGLGVVDDEDRVTEIIGHRDEAVAEEQGQGGEAGPEIAPFDGGDLRLEVAAGALGPLPGRRGPAVQEFGGRRKFPESRDRQAFDLFQGPLAGDVELTEGDDPRAVELYPKGVDLPGREDVDDAAAPGVFAGRGDEVLLGVAVPGEGFEEEVVVGLGADFEAQEKSGQVLRDGNGLEQAAEASDDDGRRCGQEPAEKLHPRRRRVEGRRDFEVRIIGERREAGQPGVGRQPGQEKTAFLLDRGQGGGFGPDENDRSSGRPCQAGQDVGLGRLDDAVDRKRPVARSDGADEGAELVRAEQEIKAHRAILTLDRHAVKPGDMLRFS